jgi:hypothetical protein
MTARALPPADGVEAGVVAADGGDADGGGSFTAPS